MNNFKKIVVLMLALVLSFTVLACDETVTVIFDSQGGSTVLPITVDVNTEIPAPNSPTRDNYTFNGWTLNGNSVTFPLTVTQDKVLYAQWQPRQLLFTIRNGEVTITGPINQNVSEIVIPAYIDELPVTSIGSGAFWNISTLTSVTLNEGLQTIGSSAFENTSIANVVIPSSLISIGGRAFAGITTLTSVTLNDGLQTIGFVAFVGTSITNIYIPSSVISIGDAAFEGVTTLTSVILNEGLQTIGEGAFTHAGIIEINIPESVINIGAWAFGGITTLTSVTLNKGLQTIGNDAFWGTGITEVTIPLTVTSIGSRAFDSNVNVILLGKLNQLGFEIINGEARILGFNFGQSADVLIIPTHINGYPVTSIGESAFQGTSITELYIPGSVISIGFEAFDGIRTLTRVTLNEGLEAIGEGAFVLTSITEINVPGSVISIGGEAFGGIKTLTSVTLNEGLRRIGDSAFSWTSITEITIPSTVTFIGSNAFPPETTVIRD